MPQHDIPLTQHDILFLKMVSIVMLLTVVGTFLYKEFINEKRK